MPEAAYPGVAVAMIAEESPFTSPEAEFTLVGTLVSVAVKPFVETMVA
jgi:hypothetical protein